MRQISEYQTMQEDELYHELIEVSRVLAAKHIELGTFCSDQHVSYLQSYLQSPGNSVAAKNREAEFNTKELTREIIELKAVINALTIQRDLITFLLLKREPSTLIMYPPASIDAEGLSA